MMKQTAYVTEHCDWYPSSPKDVFYIIFQVKCICLHRRVCVCVCVARLSFLLQSDKQKTGDPGNTVDYNLGLIHD